MHIICVYLLALRTSSSILEFKEEPDETVSVLLDCCVSIRYVIYDDADKSGLEIQPKILKSWLVFKP